MIDVDRIVNDGLLGLFPENRVDLLSISVMAPFKFLVHLMATTDGFALTIHSRVTDSPVVTLYWSFLVVSSGGPFVTINLYIQLFTYVYTNGTFDLFYFILIRKVNMNSHKSSR